MPLRLRQCERSSHLCKQSVKENRLADCKRIIRHAAFTPVKSLAVIGQEEPFRRVVTHWRPEICADQVEARLWLVLTLMPRGVLAVIG